MDTVVAEKLGRGYRDGCGWCGATGFGADGAPAVGEALAAKPAS
jgi:hypothetical protein